MVACCAVYDVPDACVASTARASANPTEDALAKRTVRKVRGRRADPLRWGDGHHDPGRAHLVPRLLGVSAATRKQVVEYELTYADVLRDPSREVAGRKSGVDNPHEVRCRTAKRMNRMGESL